MVLFSCGQTLILGDISFLENFAYTTLRINNILSGVPFDKQTY